MVSLAVLLVQVGGLDASPATVLCLVKARLGNAKGRVSYETALLYQQRPEWPAGRGKRPEVSRGHHATPRLVVRFQDKWSRFMELAP